MPGHNDNPSCSRNQAPSAIDSTVTEKITNASAKRPCAGIESGMSSCCAMAAAVRCSIRDGNSIPAARLHAQPLWPHYHQLLAPAFGTSFRHQLSVPAFGTGLWRRETKGRWAVRRGSGDGSDHLGDAIVDLGDVGLGGDQRWRHDQSVERDAHIDVELVIHVLGGGGAAQPGLAGDGFKIDP